MEVEKLDLDNVLELQKIRDILLQYDPKLLSFLEEIVSVANKKLNDEHLVVAEKETQVDLSSDDEDINLDLVLESDCEDD